MICRPVAATGQLVGHCIGGKVSSKLHFQWPGTPGALAMVRNTISTCNAVARNTSSYNCIGGKVSSKLHLQWPGTPEAAAATCASGAKELSGLHKESASRNYQHQAQMEKETQEQPEVYPRCPR